jgi:hypothetical protein
LNIRWELIKLHRPQLLFLKDLHGIVEGKESPLTESAISCVVPIIIAPCHGSLVLIRKLLSGINIAPPNRLWFVIPAKAGIQEWGFPDGHSLVKHRS